MEKIMATIVKQPVSVTFECPECMYENEIDYDTYSNCIAPYDHCDWGNELVKCENCGTRLRVTEYDWD